MNEQPKRPQAIKLTQAEATAMVDLIQKERALAIMMEQFQAQYEKRNVELQQNNRALWKTLADKYCLDLKTVSYGTSFDGQSIVPQMQKFFTE